MSKWVKLLGISCALTITMTINSLASESSNTSWNKSTEAYEIIKDTADVFDKDTIIAKAKVYEPIEIPLDAKFGDEYTFDGITYVKTADGIDIKDIGVHGWTYLKPSPDGSCYWMYGLDDLRQNKYAGEMEILIDINARDIEKVTNEDKQISFNKLRKGYMYDEVYFNENGKVVCLINSAP